MVFSFSIWPLKLWRERLTCGTFFMANVHSLPLFFCSFWPSQLKSRWKKCSPWVKNQELVTSKSSVHSFLVWMLNICSTQLSGISWWRTFVPLGVFLYSVYATFSLCSILSLRLFILSCLSQFFPCSVSPWFSQCNSVQLSLIRSFSLLARRM